MSPERFRTIGGHLTDSIGGPEGHGYSADPKMIRHGVPLAPFTTLGLGGNAADFARARDEDELIEAIGWADDRDRPTWILGGGSNVVIADEGLDGLVVRLSNRGLEIETDGPRARLRVAAGEPWDGVVAQAVAANLSGIECLSGIPGLAGATPIQNVGAYGQEIGDVLQNVRAYDRTAKTIVELTPADCALTYRDSALRREPDRWVVLQIELELAVGGVPEIRYAELERSLRGGPVTPARTRENVVALRRAKSMVIEPNDPNRRSAGSFFTNPIVAADVAAEVERRARARGLLVQRDLPAWPVGDRIKLAAGWLIEAAGFRKGTRRGAVGISSAHALALVHHGGGTTADLLRLAREIRDGVLDVFGVELRPEPVMLGVEF